MGATRNTGYLENLIQYDASDNVAIATSVNPSYKVTLGGSMLGTSAVFSSSVSVNGSTSVDSLTVNRNAANNTGGITLYNADTGGYGSAVTFRVNYAGVYNTGRIHGDWGAGNTGILHFFTANTSQALVERMTINGSGNVGIGTTSPGKLLTLESNGNNLDTGTVLRLIGNSAQDLVDISVSDTKTRIYHQENAADAANGYGILQLRTNATPNSSFPTRGGFQFTIGSTDAMFITSMGNVGIGTTSPNRLFEVSTGSDTYARVTGNRGNADGVHIANIEFYNSFSTRLAGEVRGITGTGGTQSNSGQLAFYTNDNGTYAERMRITSGGNVGIGTTSPSTLLHLSASGANGLLLDQSTSDSTTSSRFFIRNNSQTYAMLVDSSGWNFTSGATAGSSSGTPRMTITSSGVLIAPIRRGASYSQTSGSGTATSIVDTGITYSTYTSTAMYMVSWGGNPNGAGSSAYKMNAIGYISVVTGWSGSAVINSISYSETFKNSAPNIAVLSLSAVFWNGSSESTTQAEGTNSQIRIKITGYNTSATGQDQYVYLTRIN